MRVELERRLAVPLDAEPAQRALDLRDRLLDLAARVRVLDPEQALAPGPAREEPVEEERADAADVEEPGRATAPCGRGRTSDPRRHRREKTSLSRDLRAIRACGFVLRTIRPVHFGAHVSRRRRHLERRSTASRRSAATPSRSSRRARGCGGRRSTPEEELERFRTRRQQARVKAVLCHALYLVNLASPDATSGEVLAALRATMETAAAIGADAVVFHVGSHLGSGFEEASSASCPRSASSSS